MHDEMPDWDWPFLKDCYTGPWWSDCKFQSSVADGKRKPRSKLEALSKRHDEQYKLCSDDDCLFDADIEYYQSSRGLSFVPRTIGTMPLRFNRERLRGSGKNVDKKNKMTVIKTSNMGSVNAQNPKVADKVRQEQVNYTLRREKELQEQAKQKAEADKENAAVGTQASTSGTGDTTQVCDTGEIEAVEVGTHYDPNSEYRTLNSTQEYLRLRDNNFVWNPRWKRRRRRRVYVA